MLVSRLQATKMAGDRRARASTDLRPDMPLEPTRRDSPPTSARRTDVLCCVQTPLLRVQTQVAPIEAQPTMAVLKSGDSATELPCAGFPTPWLRPASAPVA
jgi:hypothetical protein